MVGSGELIRVLPAIYAWPAPRWTIRVAAAMAWDPDAVICGRAAAALTYWPGLTVTDVDVASPRVRAVGSGFAFSQRYIPAELVQTRSGLRWTCPALSAIDLAATAVGGDAIDHVLRLRAATLVDLRAALATTPYRRGNRERAQLLLDSRSEPWSAAERCAHRLLRAAGITGWVANHAVKIRTGAQVSTYYLDICFRSQRIAVEIDGRMHHSSAAVFENDRYRQNDVVLAGWTVLRFTWAMLVQQPEYVLTAIRAALR